MRGTNHPQYKEKALVTCIQCGKLFLTYQAWAKRGRKFCSNECRYKWQSEHRIGDNNPNWEGKANHMKEKCADPQFKKHWLKTMLTGLIRKPTSPEQKIIDLIQEHQLPLRYVGDGKIIIGSLNPDFVSTNGPPKVIEVFGRVFHEPNSSFRKEIPWYQQYWGRMAYFSQRGYDCLILWDDEIGEDKLVLDKITSFIGGI